MVETFQIKDIVLYLSEPDEIPRVDWIGGETYLSQILAAWYVFDEENDIPMNPQILGKPGVGKTTLAYNAAKKLNRPVYIMQCTVDTRPEDLIITPVIGKDQSIRYHASPLVTAMIKGGVCILDEANRMGEKSWASLASLLDHRRYVESIIAGIKIHAHPDFRIVVTMNEDSSTFEIPEYIHSRLQPQIFIDFPDSKEEFKILKFHVPNSPDILTAFLVKFLQYAHNENKSFSVRDGINICRYYLRLNEFKKRFGGTVLKRPRHSRKYRKTKYPKNPITHSSSFEIKLFSLDELEKQAYEEEPEENYRMNKDNMRNYFQGKEEGHEELNVDFLMQAIEQILGEEGIRTLRDLVLSKNMTKKNKRTNYEGGESPLDSVEEELDLENQNLEEAFRKIEKQLRDILMKELTFSKPIHLSKLFWDNPLKDNELEDEEDFFEGMEDEEDEDFFEDMEEDDDDDNLFMDDDDRDFSFARAPHKFFFSTLGDENKQRQRDKRNTRNNQVIHIKDEDEDEMENFDSDINNIKFINSDQENGAVKDIIKRFLSKHREKTPPSNEDEKKQDSMKDNTNNPKEHHKHKGFNKEHNKNEKKG